MKKLLFIFICIVIISGGAGAQGMLRVTTKDNYVISVAVDNRFYKKHNRSLTIGNLPSGKHWVQVYSYNPHAQNRDGNGFRRRDLLYEGRIKIHSDELTTCIVDASTGNADIQRGPASQQENNPNSGDDMYAGNNNSIAPPDTAAISSPDNANNITNDEISKLGRKVSDKVTDTDKMKKMKDGLKNKSVSTAQVAVMMNWLNFESTRVEFTEWAYSITSDKENYKQLEGKFGFNKSKEQLDEYMQGQKNNK